MRQGFCRMLVGNLYLFYPVFVQRIAQVDTLLFLLLPLLANYGCIYQEHLFRSRKTRSVHRRKQGRKHPMQYFMQKWGSFGKLFAPSSIRNSRNSKRAGGNYQDQVGKNSIIPVFKNILYRSI